MILQEVSEWAGRFGFAIDRAEVVARLTELVEGGYVMAFRLDPYPGQISTVTGKPIGLQLEGMPALPVEADGRFEIYFYPTVKGFEAERVWLPPAGFCHE